MLLDQWPLHTAKADMAHRAVDGLGMASGRTVSPAIIRAHRCDPPLTILRAMRTVGCRRIIASGLRAASRIARDATALCGILGMVRRPKVASPFPHIADHVVESVSIRRETTGPAKFVRIRRGRVSETESPLQVLAICRPAGLNSSPRRIRRRPGRREPRIPIRPRSAAACLPSAHKLRRLRTRYGRPGDRQVP
jgi:hypothetical protein